MEKNNSSNGSLPGMVSELKEEMHELLNFTNEFVDQFHKRYSNLCLKISEFDSMCGDAKENYAKFDSVQNTSNCVSDDSTLYYSMENHNVESSLVSANGHRFTPREYRNRKSILCDYKDCKQPKIGVCPYANKLILINQNNISPNEHRVLKKMCESWSVKQFNLVKAALKFYHTKRLFKSVPIQKTVQFLRDSMSLLSDMSKNQTPDNNIFVKNLKSEISEKKAHLHWQVFDTTPLQQYEMIKNGKTIFTPNKYMPQKHNVLKKR